MGKRIAESSQLETILADHQRLKEENAALRRLLVETYTAGYTREDTVFGILPLMNHRPARTSPYFRHSFRIWWT